MKRTSDSEPEPGCSKRHCSMSPSSASECSSMDSPLNFSCLDLFFEEVMKSRNNDFDERENMEDDTAKKEFYEGENGIIQLKENIISIVDKTPRVIHKYALAAFKKPGVYFAQSKTELLGPFFITPTPNDLPKGELLMIYECCSSRFSETSTSCFRPIGLFQN